MTKKKKIDFDKYASGLFLRTEQYADRVRRHYASAVDELLKISSNAQISPEETFSFADNKKMSGKANEILRGLYSAVYNEIKNGVAAEWEYANISCDALIESIFGKGLEEDDHFARWFSRNQEATDAFFTRKSAYGGLNLSQKVWKYTGDLKTEMELALSLSLGEGNSASKVSREVRKYLQEPERLFRRIKIGTDANGNPRYKLSKAAKAYHPGRGVYRSSYKNAMRLTRTETNMAYKTAEQDRWQRMDFVVGYEIKTSNNHPDRDICDELKGKYPKDFKFVGWHPQCRCYVVPILAEQDEFVNMQKKILEGEDVSNNHYSGKITEVPEKFSKWIENNRERIENAGSLPYFIKDNFVDGNVSKGLRFVIIEPETNVFIKAKSFDEIVKRIQKTGIESVKLGEATLEEANIALEAIEIEAKGHKLDLSEFSITSNLGGKRDIGGYFNESERIIRMDINIFRQSIYKDAGTWDSRIANLEEKIAKNKDEIAKYEGYLGKNKKLDKEIKGYIANYKQQILGFEKEIYQFNEFKKAGIAPHTLTFAEQFKDIHQQAKAQIHHEFGHYADAKMGRPSRKGIKHSISEYGDKMDGEGFAEWYSYYRMKGTKGLPTELKEIFEEYDIVTLNKMAVDAGRIRSFRNITSKEQNNIISEIRNIGNELKILPKNVKVDFTDDLADNILMAWDGEFIKISRAEFIMDNGSLFCPANDLFNAFKKLNGVVKGDLTFNEEYAIEVLFHESIHTRQHIPATNYLSNTILEVCTQLYARNNYVKILSKYGRKPSHFELIKTNGYGYKLGCNILRKYFTKDGILQIGELVNIANGTEDGVKTLLKKFREYNVSKEEQRIIIDTLKTMIKK